MSAPTLVRLLGALTGTLALALSSCTSTLAIKSMQPGPVNIGATRHLVLLHGEGRRSAREFVSHDLDRQARHRGYFSYEDRSEDGVEVKIAGRSVNLDGASFHLAPTHAGLRIDVLEWNAYRDVSSVRRYDDTGAPYMHEVPVQRGNVLLALTLFDQSGHALLAEAEYEGVVECEPDVPREQVIELAASDAVSSFLDDITPHQVVSRVRLDEDDDGQESFLEMAREGQVAYAADGLRSYLQADPNNAIAAYNLAVLLEAMGHFEEALSFYDKAIALGGKDYYHRARVDCARRYSSTQALAPQS